MFSLPTIVSRIPVDPTSMAEITAESSKSVRFYVDAETGDIELTFPRTIEPISFPILGAVVAFGSRPDCHLKNRSYSSPCVSAAEFRIELVEFSCEPHVELAALSFPMPIDSKMFATASIAGVIQNLTVTSLNSAIQPGRQRLVFNLADDDATQSEATRFQCTSLVRGRFLDHPHCSGDCILWCSICCHVHWKCVHLLST